MNFLRKIWSGIVDGVAVFAAIVVSILAVVFGAISCLGVILLSKVGIISVTTGAVTVLMLKVGFFTGIAAIFVVPFLTLAAGAILTLIGVAVLASIAYVLTDKKQ